MRCYKATKKIISMLLTAIFTMSLFTACSEKADPEGELTEYAQETVEDFFDRLRSSLRYNSLRDIEFPELTDEQQELMEYAYSETTVKVGNVEIDDNNDEKGTVELVFSNYKAYSEDMAFIGTMDEFKAAVDDIKGEKVTLKLKAVKDDNDEWIFKDLRDVAEMFYEPYDQLCFLDEEGNPINITEAYSLYIAEQYTDLYVNSYWYDPQMGNPLDSGSIPFVVDALQLAFYFNSPISGSFTAELIRDNQSVATIELTVNEGVMILCDFPAGEQGFGNGSYTVKLCTGGICIASSVPLRVG